MTFADKIKYARAELNLSQERFANLLGVSFATVNRLEKGRATPSYATVLKFESLCKQNKIEFSNDAD